MKEKIKRILNYCGWIGFPILILFLITGSEYEQWNGVFVVVLMVGIFYTIFDIISNKKEVHN